MREPSELIKAVFTFKGDKRRKIRQTLMELGPFVYPHRITKQKDTELFVTMGRTPCCENLSEPELVKLIEPMVTNRFSSIGQIKSVKWLFVRRD